MRYDSFFKEVPGPPDPWGGDATPTLKLEVSLLRQLAAGPISGDDPLETALTLTRIAHDEFELYGTSGDQITSDEESGVLLRTLRGVLERQGVDFTPQWRDFPSFRTFWNRNGGYGSWQVRREMVEDLFGPVTQELDTAYSRGLQARLTEAVSSHEQLGWPNVDNQLDQLRARFRTAVTPVDYKDVGNRCVGVLEALSAQVYDVLLHCPPGMDEPPVDRTDIRIGAYIDERLKGSSNEELRGLTKKASALAHKMKHSPRADRTTTGIAADTVILLANILRRLQDAE